MRSGDDPTVSSGFPSRQTRNEFASKRRLTLRPLPLTSKRPSLRSGVSASSESRGRRNLFHSSPRPSICSDTVPCRRRPSRPRLSAARWAAFSTRPTRHPGAADLASFDRGRRREDASYFSHAERNLKLDATRGRIMNWIGRGCAELAARRWLDTVAGRIARLSSRCRRRRKSPAAQPLSTAAAATPPNT